MQIQTIRKRLVKVASKLVKSGRSLYFKLSSNRLPGIILENLRPNSATENKLAAVGLNLKGLNGVKG